MVQSRMHGGLSHTMVGSKALLLSVRTANTHTASLFSTLFLTNGHRATISCSLYFFLSHHSRCPFELLTREFRPPFPIHHSFRSNADFIHNLHLKLSSLVYFCTLRHPNQVTWLHNFCNDFATTSLVAGSKKERTC